jgi:hypothetical protein
MPLFGPARSQVIKPARIAVIPADGQCTSVLRALHRCTNLDLTTTNLQSYGVPSRTYVHGVTTHQSAEFEFAQLRSERTLITIASNRKLQLGYPRTPH